MFSLNWTDLDNEDIDGKDTSELQLINIEWEMEWKKSPTGNHKKIVSGKDHQWMLEGVGESTKRNTTFVRSQSIFLTLIAKGKIVTS